MLWERLRLHLIKVFGKGKGHHGLLAWLLSKHCVDLFKTFAITTALAVAVILLDCVFVVSELLDGKGFATSLSVVIAAWVTLFQFLANAANTRAGVAAVFESEIRNVTAAIDSFGIIPALANTDLNEEQQWKLLKVRMKTRSENYMEAFARNVDRLANLPGDAVTETVAFYTYFKASRDAAAVIGTWNSQVPLDQKNRDVEKTLQLLADCINHGEAAVTALTEDDSERTVVGTGDGISSRAVDVAVFTRLSSEIASCIGRRKIDSSILTASKSDISD